MEIFGDGELEHELQRSDLQGSGLFSWWRVFSDTYEELVQSVASPARAEYTLDELGERELHVRVENVAGDGSSEATSDCEVVRRDFRLRNARDEALECSFWQQSASQPASASAPPPCVVYLHGMSSSRKECVYLRRRVLRAGFSLFALDFSGAGKSGGDRVSFGYFERDDVRAVVDYLYATRSASRVALWGRDIGAVAAMLYVRDRLEYRYETWEVAPREVKNLLVVEDKATTVASAADANTGTAALSSGAVHSGPTAHQLLCIRQPPKGSLSFRWSKYSAHNGDFVLLAVDGELVEGKDPAACVELMRRRVVEKHTGIKKAGSGSGDTAAPSVREATVQLTGYRRKYVSGKAAGATQDDAFVFALAADSAYGDMEQVIWDMLTMVSQSAERRSLYIPGPMVTGIQKLLTNSIGRTGGYNLRDVRLLDVVPHFSLPCLFTCATKKDFFMPSHTMALLEKYGGPKRFVQFTGRIEDNRPEDVLDSVLNHFGERLRHA